IKRRYVVDDNKIFVTGFSDGGSGSFHFAFHHPTPFAGFIPLNGSSLVAQYGGEVFAQNLLHKRPLYVVNTTEDTLYPAEQQRKLIDFFKEAGGNIEFTVYEKIGHRLDYIDKERPKIRDFIKKTVREPLPRNVVWMTDDVKERGRFAWVVVEELGETGGEKPILKSPKFTPRLVLGVVIDQEYQGEGARVSDVAKDSTAAEMGIKAGDVIVKIDTNEVKSFQDLRVALSKKRFGDEVSVVVKRDGEEVVLKGKFPKGQEVDAFEYPKPFCSIEVSVNGNRIDVKTYRVKKYRLLVSSKMFPRDTKVEVYTNGVLSFSSVVAPDIATLLFYAASDMDRSMLFYGSIGVTLEEKGEREGK
ncbi:MAG: PDZ domain-containing protein, partial [Planctomycetota bacterium]|nr:PDZ domain-containing protein [Planctomycetota bacterium]